MSKSRKNLYDILRGSFLTDESSSKNWRILFFVVILLLIMISSSHSTDAKVVKIYKLNEEKRKLRCEDIKTSTKLMQMKLESNIRYKVKEKGLFPANTPPSKIKVSYNKE